MNNTNTYTSPKGTKYVLGYYNKLMYWKGRLNNALIAGDPVALQIAAGKIEYFTAKHINWLNAID